MSRKGENIYVRKDGRWEGRYIKTRSSDGKYHYGYVYARTYREAKEKLVLQKSRNMDSFTDVLEEPVRQDSQILFRTIAQSWLQGLKPQIKESTFMKYYNMVHTYLLPELGDLPYFKIRRETIEAFCNQMLISGGARHNGLSPKTVSDLLSILRNIFRYAGICGYMISCDLSSVNVKQSPKRFRILSRNEQKQLCCFLSANMNERNLGILLSLYAGLRLGEICALKWEDISYKENIIFVHKTMQRIQTRDSSKARTKIIVTTPKSPCSIRRIPLPQELITILKQFDYEPNAYILTGSSNSIVEPRAMQRHFKKVLSNVPMESMNYHTLRHTFATRCVEMNFDVKSLSEILGHASVTITMNRYVHPSMELKRENMERLSELLAVN